MADVETVSGIKAQLAMMQGRSVRRLSWNDESYQALIDGVPKMVLGGRITDCKPHPHEMQMTDWVILP